MLLREHELQALTRGTVSGGTSPVTGIAAPPTFGNPIIVSRTVASTGDPVLIVAVHMESASSTVASVTYGAASLWRILRKKATNFGAVEFWALMNPAVGTDDVTVTYGANADARGIAAYVFYGVDQSEPFFPVMGTNADTGTSVTQDVPLQGSGQKLVDALGLDGTGASNTAGANQTEDFDIEIAAGTHTMVGSIQAGSDGGTMSHSWTTNRPFAFIALGLRAAQASGTGYTQNPADSVTMSDAVVFDLVKGVADSVAMSDAQARDLGKLLADTLGLADSLASAKDVPLAPADSVTMSDGSTQELGKTVNPADSVTMGDAIVMDRGVLLPDTVGLADQVVFDRGILLSDSVTMADLAAFAREMIFGDTLGLADSATPLITKVVNVDDTVSVADSMVFVVDHAFSVNDTLPLTDLVSFDRAVTVQDALSLADAVARSYGLSTGDVVTMSDLADPQNVSGATDHTLNVDDSVTLADALTFIRGVLKTDSVAVFDAHERRLNGVLLSDGDIAVIRQGIVYIGRF